jgi:hypothetical protein
MALSFGLGSAILHLLPSSSRKRDVSSAAAAAADAFASAPPKRARRQETTNDADRTFDAAVRTPPPPSSSSDSTCRNDDDIAIFPPASSSSTPALEPSTTFESSSSSSGVGDVDVDDDDDATEGRRRRRRRRSAGGDRGAGFDAVSAARARLRSARLCASHSLETLRRARSEYGRTTEEARRADECLRSMERKWEVVDVDDDENDDDDDENTSASSRSSTPSQIFEYENEEGMPRILRVSRAGDDIVNGTYRRTLLLAHSLAAARTTTLDCRSRVGSSMPTTVGSIYVNADGPFDVRGDLHDACIFRRDGYGDKARWCIGLVPRRRRRRRRRRHPPVEDADRMDDDDEVDDAEDDDVERRQIMECDRGGFGGWDFAMAYIYYWMEVDANVIDDASSLLSNRIREGGASSLSLSSSSLSSSWGACHGARPPPMMEDVSDGGTMARWWQFWKQG